MAVQFASGGGGALTSLHRRRLREVWRSAGWPCQDLVEVELLAAGWLERQRDGDGRETLRVTDAGVQVLAETLARNRAARDPHEALVARVAREMQRAGRIVWRGLSLRAPLQTNLPASSQANSPALPADQPDPGVPADAAPWSSPTGMADELAGDSVQAQTQARARWVMAMPDVYSIRHTTVEDYAEPVVHEIKVRRADLLSDLKRSDKGAAYRALSSQCWYVLARGIADADEVPADYGVMLADAGGLEVARPAPRRAHRLSFATWVALARAHAERGDDVEAQAWLGADAHNPPSFADPSRTPP